MEITIGYDKNAAAVHAWRARAEQKAAMGTCGTLKVPGVAKVSTVEEILVSRPIILVLP